jgi:hypothetical protein
MDHFTYPFATGQPAANTGRLDKIRAPGPDRRDRTRPAGPASGPRLEQVQPGTTRAQSVMTST